MPAITRSRTAKRSHAERVDTLLNEMLRPYQPKSLWFRTANRVRMRFEALPNESFDVTVARLGQSLRNVERRIRSAKTDLADPDLRKDIWEMQRGRRYILEFQTKLNEMRDIVERRVDEEEAMESGNI